MVVEHPPDPEKLLCQPQVRENMIRHGRDMEATFSFRERGKE
jgi:hypothetical protein